jgi:ribosomal protein S18 acetylase RimI-like enzyme
MRSASIDDAAALARLWQAAGLAGSPDIAEAEIRERLTRDEDLFVVGEDDAGIVASVMGCYDGHRGWLKRVAVRPDLHGEGMGRRIVAEAERRFAARGITKLRLAVWGENTAALSFWAELGYEDERGVHYHAKDLDGPGDGDPC